MSDEGHPSCWPVVPFERYLIADDRHDEPMTFPMVFSLAGKIDRQAWRRAVEESLRRHPLLRSRLVGRGRSLGWQVGSSDPGSSDLVPGDDARIDLRGASPFRYRWVERGQGIDLCCRFHHAVVDGIGAIQFLGDCFARYDQLVRDDSPAKWIRLDESLLASRGETGAAPSSVAQVPATAEAAAEATDESPRVGASGVINAVASEVRRFFFRKVTPLACQFDHDGAGEDDGAGGQDGTGEHDGEGEPSVWRWGNLYQMELEADASARVRNSASSLGVTLNDLALRDLMMTLRDENGRCGAVGRWYRITMPVNLRQRRHRRMPACNRIGYAFIDRDLSVAPDPASLLSLLSGLSRENALIRAERLTEMFLGVLGAVTRVPGLMYVLTSRRARVATTVFSNLGDPTRRFYSRLPRRDGVVTIGDATFRGFAAAPPVRPNTPASFLLSQFNGRVALNVLISPRQMTAGDATRLLGAWRDRLLACDDR